MPDTPPAHNEPYDIIIVGSGPAGISTALHLARLAPDLVPGTLILEKARHPRPKLCGGGVLPDGEVILLRLGLDITEIPHVDVDWAHFDFDGQGMFMRAKDGMPYAFRTIQRDEFDAWLASKARQRGFNIQEETTVKALSVDDGWVHLETNRGRYTTRVVVGADGSNSIVRHAIAPLKGSLPARLLEIYTPPNPAESAHIQKDSYFDFISIPAGASGYIWDFPVLVKGQPMRCRGVYDANHVKRPGRQPLIQILADEFQRHGQDLNAYQLASHPIRWFDAGSPFSAPHVILAGDAAGADALYGEGISIALGYGKLAAEALHEAFQRDEFSFDGYRQRVLRDPLGIALRRRTFMSKVVYRLTSPVIQALIWRRLGWLVKWAVRAFLIGWSEKQRP